MTFKPPVPESCRELDLRKAARELIKTGGNVSTAAERLGVPIHDLRLLTRAYPRLIEAALEAEEQALDEAEAVLRAALRHKDGPLRLAAAGHIVRTNPAARRRGW